MRDDAVSVICRRQTGPPDRGWTAASIPACGNAVPLHPASAHRTAVKNTCAFPLGKHMSAAPTWCCSFSLTFSSMHQGQGTRDKLWHHTGEPVVRIMARAVTFSKPKPFGLGACPQSIFQHRQVMTQNVKIICIWGKVGMCGLQKISVQTQLQEYDIVCGAQARKYSTGFLSIFPC